jgi:hypothetical protein
MITPEKNRKIVTSNLPLPNSKSSNPLAFQAILLIASAMVIVIPGGIQDQADVQWIH